MPNDPTDKARARYKTVTRRQQDLLLLQRVLDLQDRGVVVLTREGYVRFVTGKARQWLAEYFGYSEKGRERLPESLIGWMKQQEVMLGATCKDSSALKPLVIQSGSKQLMVRLALECDHFVLIFEERPASLEPAFLRPLGLTWREAEVLAWVAQGKTSADIGKILGSSPRTIATHLQRIYQKLGVETRTAAAMRAISFISSRET